MINWAELGPPLAITATAVLAGAAYGFRCRQAGAPNAFAAGTNIAAAAQVLLFVLSHTIATLGERLLGKTKPTGLIAASIADVQYDFRFYALVLVGILFVMQAVVMLRSYHRLTGEDPAASRCVRWACWKVVILGLPLAPLSPGIPFLVAPALVSILAQTALRWRSLQLLEARATV